MLGTGGEGSRLPQERPLFSPVAREGRSAERRGALYFSEGEANSGPERSRAIPAWSPGESRWSPEAALTGIGGEPAVCPPPAAVLTPPPPRHRLV